MRRLDRILIATLALAGGAAWFARGTLESWWSGPPDAVAATAKPAAPQPDPAAYATLAGEAERWRLGFASRHQTARSDDERAAVEDDVRVFLEFLLPEMMRCWLGTPWDFHGTASRPGEGEIACGYFVSTVLRDAGFRVDRYRLAQQPSANILRSFLAKEDCHLSVGLPYENFATDMEGAEPGIYVVGLDTHVAFIVAGAGGFRFIHSSGSRPWCVVEESRQAAEVLQRSNWRMLGNLTASRQLIRRWLSGGEIKVHGT
jgi:hypothetical protein